MTMSKTKRIVVLCMAIVALAQFAAPAWMVFRQEKLLSEGETYLFKCEPVDPYDPFRGNYVVLSFKNGSQNIRDADYKPGAEAHMTFTVDKDGFAWFDKVTMERPSGKNYVTCGVKKESYGDHYKVEIPFHKYFLNQQKAPEVERVMPRRWDKKDKHEVVVKVKIKDGKSAVENLLIDGSPVNEYLKKQSGEK